MRAAVPIALSVAAMLAAACNSADTTAASTANFTTNVVLTADTITVPLGDSADIALTLTRGGGYTDAVSFSIDTLPTGVTGVFSPQTLLASGTASKLTLTAGSTAVAGTTSVRFRAAGFGVADDTLSIVLKVVPPAIALTSGATTATATVGGSASIPLTFDRINGYTDIITLTAENVPANVTATFLPALVPNGSATSTLVLSPIAGAVPGTSTITIRAAGRNTGVTQKTVPVAFTVAPSASADFAPSVSTAAIALVAGSTAQTTVALNRVGGLASNVNFSLAGLPAGVTASFSSNPVSTASTVITFSATSTVALGRYNLTLTGTAAGGATHTIPLVVTTVAPQSAKIVAVTPALNVAKGGVGQTALIVTRVGGLVGTITLTADSLPSGVTPTFLPAALAGSQTASVFGFSVNASTVSGTYTIVLRATAGAGTATAATVGSANVVLTVP